MPAPQKTQPIQQDDDWEGSVAAASRGGLDAATLGLADQASAATDATLAMMRGQDWYNKYKSDRAQQTAQTQYDAQHHAFAQRTGQLIGTVIGMAVTDGMTAPQATRIAFTAPKLEASVVRALRPWAAAGGVGAGASVGGQGLSDFASGHVSSPQTYLSDAAGGAVGGVATLARSPAAGAAAQALVSGATQSALTGQPMQFDDIEKNALAGAYLGVLGHGLGKDWSNSLDWRTKGQLGEDMAKATSSILGDEIQTGKIRSVKVSGGRTIPDHVTNQGPVEAKFGYKAELSRRQKEAFNELPDYSVYHFLPDDVGRITGGLLALANAQSSGRNKPPRTAAKNSSWLGLDLAD